MALNDDIEISAISALILFADSRYADIADADINIDTALLYRVLPQTGRLRNFGKLYKVEYILLKIDSLNHLTPPKTIQL